VENTLWKRLWTCRQTDYAENEYVFVCVSCNIYGYVFVSNSSQFHIRTAVLVSTERIPTNGKNDYVQNFPLLAYLSSAPSGVKSARCKISQPKVLIPGEVYHVVITANIRVN